MRYFFSAMIALVVMTFMTATSEKYYAFIPLIIFGIVSALQLFFLLASALYAKERGKELFYYTIGGVCFGMNAMIILFYFYPLESLKGFLW